VSAQTYTPAQAKAMAGLIVKQCSDLNSKTCKSGLSMSGAFCSQPKNLAFCEQRSTFRPPTPPPSP
jgi:hypothetical protein